MTETKDTTYWEILSEHGLYGLFTDCGNEIAATVQQGSTTKIHRRVAQYMKQYVDIWNDVIDD